MRTKEQNHHLPAKIGYKDDIVIIMYKRYSKYYKHWRDYDKLTSILAVIGLVLAIVEVGIHNHHFYWKVKIC